MAERHNCDKKFSSNIMELLNKIPDHGMTLRMFLVFLGDRGRLIACMLLATPFLLPFSFPGTGFIIGFIIFAISMSIMVNREFIIPKRLMNSPITHENLNKILYASLKLLNFLERYIKPRLLLMTNRKPIRKVNYIFLVISSLYFILPLPIPLTDTLPAFSVFFLSAGILECDGYLILAGYIMVVLTTIYFSIMILIGYNLLFNHVI